MKYFTLILIISFLQAALASEKGFFQEIELRTQNSTNELTALLKQALKYPLASRSDLKKLNLNLSKKYLKIVLFTSNPIYLSLFKKNDECRFAELVHNDLIKPIDKIIYEQKTPPPGKINRSQPSNLKL